MKDYLRRQWSAKCLEGLGKRQSVKLSFNGVERERYPEKACTVSDLHNWSSCFRLPMKAFLWSVPLIVRQFYRVIRVRVFMPLKGWERVQNEHMRSSRLVQLHNERISASSSQIVCAMICMFTQFFQEKLSRIPFWSHILPLSHILKLFLAPCSRTSSWCDFTGNHHSNWYLGISRRSIF